jgi:hypothetical protein
MLPEHNSNDVIRQPETTTGGATESVLRSSMAVDLRPLSCQSRVTALWRSFPKRGNEPRWCHAFRQLQLRLRWLRCRYCAYIVKIDLHVCGVGKNVGGIFIPPLDRWDRGTLFSRKYVRRGVAEVCSLLFTPQARSDSRSKCGATRLDSQHCSCSSSPLKSRTV